MQAYKPYLNLVKISENSYELHIAVSVPEDMHLKRHMPVHTDNQRVIQFELIPYDYSPDEAPLIHQMVEAIDPIEDLESAVKVDILGSFDESEELHLLGSATMQYVHNPLLMQSFSRTVPNQEANNSADQSSNEDPRERKKK